LPPHCTAVGAGVDPDDEAWVLPLHADSATAHTVNMLSVTPARLRFTPNSSRQAPVGIEPSEHGRMMSERSEENQRMHARAASIAENGHRVCRRFEDVQRLAPRGDEPDFAT